MSALDMLGAVDSEDTVSEVQTEVAAVGKRVSPWLWIFSLTSFAMAV